MGAEATVRARVHGKADRGRVLLETQEVIFRGAQRCVVPLETVRARAKVAGDWLMLGTLELELGSALAGKWLEKIRNPKSVLDKLGVKEGQRAVLLDVDDSVFADALRARGLTVADSAKKNEALIFFRLRTVDSLSRLPALRRALADDGALWVLRPKGKNAPVGEAQAMAAGKAAGLVDVKVVGFSQTLSAEKYVVPMAKRGK